MGIVSKLLIIILLLGCTKYKPHYSNLDVELETRATLYLNLMERDKDGFILSEHCDSLLFTGLLAAAAPELNIDLTAARDSSGAWHRRPNKDCGPEFGNSRSSVSRDMILGVMWWAWRTKNLEVLEDLKNSLNIIVLPGTGDLITRTLLPPYYKTLLLLIEALGGTKAHYVPGGDSLSKKGGFVAHLNVWHILLRGEIKNSIPESHYKLLKYHAKREPKNPLYTEAYRLFGGSSSSGLSMYNANRLPTTDDWCSPWVIERDYSQSDWGSCTPYKEHTGADLVVLVRLLYNKN